MLRVDSFSGAHGCVFGMQATYVILLRYTLRIHVLSGVMEVWFPAFGCEKISILCKNGDLKSSILCMLYLGCHDFQYFPQCHRGYCA